MRVATFVCLLAFAGAPLQAQPAAPVTAPSSAIADSDITDLDVMVVSGVQPADSNPTWRQRSRGPMPGRSATLRR